MRYSPKLIDELVQKVDFIQLAQQYVGRIEDRGGTWWACCPFHHENTPSFTINPEKKLFYCFGCHEGGSLIQLVMRLDGLSFVATLEKLAEFSGFELPKQDFSKNQREAEKYAAEEKQRKALYALYALVHKAFSQALRHKEKGLAARLYLVKRGISGETVKNYQLGFAPADPYWLYLWLTKQNYSPELLAASGLFSKKKTQISLFWNRLIFPVMDAEGRVVAFSGRDLSPNPGPRSPKYINSGESAIYKKGSSLFGWFQALAQLRKLKQVILCEGNLDVLAFSQAGFPWVVAPLGTAFTAEQAALFKRYDAKVYLALDGDSAGRKALYKAAFLLEELELSTAVISFGEGRDPADILQKEGEKDLQSLVAQAQDLFYFMAIDLEQQHNLEELSGKSEALAFLAPFMSRIKPGLRRELFLAQFAKIFDISQETLKQEESWQYREEMPHRWKSDERSGVQSFGRGEQGSSQGELPAQREQRRQVQQTKRNWQSQRSGPTDLCIEVEREFWSWLLLQVDLYPLWRSQINELDWQSDDALFLQGQLEQAIADDEYNFETLQDRVLRERPELSDYLLRRQVEPLLQGAEIFPPDLAVDQLSYRERIFEQKLFGIQIFLSERRREDLMDFLRRQEQEEAPIEQVLELLQEKQELDRDIALLQEKMRGVSDLLGQRDEGPPHL